MKRNAIITIDATHAQVTQAFAKQARIFGTSEYKEWRAYCQDFPGAEMVTKTIKKAKNKKNDAKNRTYKKMAEYIDCQENADALKKEFEAQKKLSIVQKSPYRFVLVLAHPFNLLARENPSPARNRGRSKLKLHFQKWI